MKQIEDPKVAYRTFLSGQVARIPYYKEANSHLWISISFHFTCSISSIFILFLLAQFDGQAYILINLY